MASYTGVIKEESPVLPRRFPWPAPDRPPTPGSSQEQIEKGERRRGGLGTGASPNDQSQQNGNATSTQATRSWARPLSSGTQEDPIGVDADNFTTSYFVPLASNTRPRPELLTNGAVGPAPAGLGEATPSHGHGASQVSGSPVTSPWRHQAMLEDGRTDSSAADPPVPVPGSGESFTCESPTIESSPTRYQQFRWEEASDSATTGGDAVASSKQACGPENGASHRSFATFDKWEEEEGTVCVQVVTTREEFRSELPATNEDDPTLLADDGDELCRECCVGQEGPRPAPVDAEDNQYTVEALLDKRGHRYRVKWEGYCHKHNTWELRRDIHRKLVESFENERRKKEGARKAKRQRGVGKKVYKIRKRG